MNVKENNGKNKYLNGWLALDCFILRIELESGFFANVQQSTKFELQDWYLVQSKEVITNGQSIQIKLDKKNLSMGLKNTDFWMSLLVIGRGFLLHHSGVWCIIYISFRYLHSFLANFKKPSRLSKMWFWQLKEVYGLMGVETHGHYFIWNYARVNKVL